MNTTELKSDDLQWSELAPTKQQESCASTARNTQMMRLASLTQIVNQQQSQDFEKAKKVEQFLKASAAPYDPGDDQLITQMMQSLSKDCKELNQKIRYVLCPQEHLHIQLHTGESKTFDVLANLPVYFKVNVDQRVAPGWLHLKYAEGQYVNKDSDVHRRKKIAQPPVGAKVVDLAIYYSATGTKQPTEDKNQRCFTDPLRCVPLSPPPGLEDYGHNQWVYLTLFSATGCQVRLTVTFKEVY